MHSLAGGKRHRDGKLKKKEKNSQSIAEHKPTEVSVIKVDSKLIKCEQNNKPVIVVLRNSELLLNRDSKQSFQLLHADSTVRKNSNTPTLLYRPDIVHQCLMMLLDSPLNKARRLCIYLENIDKKIIWVSPEFRVPRTWKVFNKVLCDFLSNSQGILTSTSDTSSVLLKLLEPPLERYLMDARLVSLGSGISSGRFCRLRNHINRVILNASQLAFIIELLSCHPLEPLRTQHKLKLSTYPMAASVLCNRLCNELELFYQI